MSLHRATKSDIWIGEFTEEGERYRFSTGTADKAEAKRIAAETLRLFRHDAATRAHKTRGITADAAIEAYAKRTATPDGTSKKGS